MADSVKLLIASGNRGKLLEFREILAGSKFELYLPEEIGLVMEVEESGKTYAENAALKARAYAQASGMVVLADDSGLEVAALGGAPGLYSARYAPKIGATDADRRAYLLANLSGVPRPWTASFHCTVAVGVPAGKLYFAEGYCPGEIIPEERGEHGFGYDPIFWMPVHQLTMAEMGSDLKNKVSHRALAVQAALPILSQLLLNKQ